MPMTAPFLTTRRVEFGDTDMAGIMHFSNFFRFMEVAETDFLRERGLTVAWTKDGQRFGFPRVSATCDYSHPVRFGDLLTIIVSIERIGQKSITYRHEFQCGGAPVALGRITAVFVQATESGEWQSLEIPADLRATLDA
jgi:YbgC/YbaW family acyl-CoA thioester hydrolase